MKVLFLATPEFAVKFLEKLRHIHDVALVVTRPDMPRSRGQKPTPAPVKRYCQNNGINFLTPQNPDEIIPQIKQLNPDIAVTVAYGKILSKEFFSVPRYGTLNVHFSLLPKYRGAAPIQWSLINGEKTSGVSIFEIDEHTDTGAVYKQIPAAISPKDNALTLTDKLIPLGIEALINVLSEIEKGTAKKVPQKGTPSYAGILTKKDALIDFNFSAYNVCNKIRGLAAGPYGYVWICLKAKKMRLQITEAEVFKGDLENLGFKPATVARIERNLGFLVQCQNGLLLVKTVRPEAGKTISAWDFVNGFHIKVGDCLSIG
jgi:methionyl-tRNA formyltransferase